MANINDNYFDGAYKEIWRAQIPELLTTREIDFILNYFDLKKGDRVLDLMCGYGRHTLALARKGIHVTALDNLAGYTDEIREVAGKENLPIGVFNGDIVTFQPGGNYALAICMGNSLNFFDPADTLRILETVSGSLNNNGKLLINSWSLAEIVGDQIETRSSTEINGIKCSTESQLLKNPLRMESRTVFVTPDGNEEVKTAIDFIYSLDDMEGMFKKAGLKMKEVFSIPGKKKFTAGEPRAYMIAEKSTEF